MSFHENTSSAQTMQCVSTTADEVVGRLVSSIRVPTQHCASASFSSLVQALGRLAGAAAVESLERPIDRFGGAYEQLPCYILGTLAVARFASLHIQMAGSGHLLRIIRQQIRSELVRLPAQLPAVWLVPESPDDQTAVHVAALLMMEKGHIAKPWLWAGIPGHERFHVVGIHSTNHQAEDHPRCVGPLDLFRLAHHRSAFARLDRQTDEALCG